MSTAEVMALIKEQKQVAEFQNDVLDAMEMVRDAKGILVGDKVEIIDDLRILKENTWYGFHMEGGHLNRCNQDSKAYDNKSNNPIRIAKALVEKAKKGRK